VEAARALVRRHTPLTARVVVELGRGTDSVAFAVDDDWVFRFPIAPDAQNTLRREVALLPALGPTLPLPTPAFAHVARDGDRLLFVGYRRLAGEPLTPAAIASLPAGAQERALAALAEFLEALHAFPVAEARRAGVAEEPVKGGYHTGQRSLPHQVEHLLAADEARRLQAIFDAYERDVGADAPPVLLHSDLKPDHVLHDGAAGTIGGILDWGDVALGDPDFDLAVVALFFGPEFQARVLAHLPGRDPALIAAKTSFFTTLRWVQDLVYDLERGDVASQQLSLASLRRHLPTAQTSFAPPA